MTIQWGDTGRVAFGPLKTFNITLSTPRETLLGSPVSGLPTSNPGTPQITMTVGNSDLPTITPSPLSFKYAAVLYAGGKNTDAASQSISYQVYKNGVAISGATGTTSVPTNNFWTHSHYRFFDVSVGDVLGVSLWSASANINYDYYSLVVFPTRMNLGKAYINKDVTYGSNLSLSLTTGTPTARTDNYLQIFPTNGTQIIASSSTNLSFGALKWDGTAFSGKAVLSDAFTSSDSVTHATSRPYYARQNIPSTISFREVLR